MGYNLYARCNAHGESAYISRGEESYSISLFMKRHAARTCAVEWAVGNNYSAPRWVDDVADLYLPDDLVSKPLNPEPSGRAPRFDELRPMSAEELRRFGARSSSFAKRDVRPVPKGKP